MITIKLNGNRTEIKTYRELSLKEYKEVIEAVKNKPNYSLFDYVAYQTGYTFDELHVQKLTGIELLSKELGDIRIIRGDTDEKVKAIEDLPLKKYMTFEGKVYDISKVNVKSKVGYRITIEQFIQSKPTHLDLYVHTIATVLNFERNKNFDYDTIRETATLLDKYNAYNILGNGAFFLLNLIHGERKGARFLRMCRSILIRMRG